MKLNPFNHTLLAVGVAAVLGVATSAIAATSGTVGDTTTTVNITNKASASYNVAGVEQPIVESNEVKITVSEQVSFSLVSNNEDKSPGNDSNVNEEVAPNGIAVFKHTLTNTGNRTDSYTLLLENVTGDSTDYDLANSTVTSTIFTNGVASTPTTTSVAIANSQPFTLEKGQRIEFSINARTLGNKGGNTQNLKLSATSTILTSAKTLVNTDDSVTKLPTFSIVKTFTNALDLNNPNDTAAYRVIIRNPTTAYSTDATNIDITDNLPAGLIIDTAVTAANVTATGTGTTIGTIASNANGFTITGANLAVGGNITINFTVRKDPAVALAAGALNHVKISDDLDNNSATNNTLVDSTKTADEVNVNNFYPVNEENFIDGRVADGTNGNDSTQPLLTIDRNLTLTQATNKEIAPKTGTTSTATNGQVTHQTIITNNGKGTEGDTANELTFTITDNDAGTPDAINIVPGTVKITYTPTTGPVITSSIVPVNGIYDINTALPAGIAPGGKVTISYNVSSNSAPLFTPAAGTTATKEDTVVTLIPVGEGAPLTPIPAITDTTTVRGLTLVKTQFKDALCTTEVNTPAASAFNSNDIAAEPGQCVIYQIIANNTSSIAPLGFNITDLVISDLLSNFSANAAYVANTATSSATTGSTIGTPVVNATAITTTATTLAPQGTATMRFKVKIKSNR